jgi:DNA polymerase I-like protein with 3'-5' exonuclease and polymerase domains
MNILALDTETTTHNKGNPFDSRNKLVCWSWAQGDGSWAEEWLPSSNKVVQKIIDKQDVLVFFNGKFDYHWLAKEGVDLSHSDIWDVQLAEFILSNQTHKFPSLDETCVKYNIPKKLDVVKTEYWDKGIQTDAIPWHILRDYAAHDAKVTLECYHAQIQLMTPAQKQLCRLMCMDMHVLRDMEATGVKFDEELCAQRAQEVEKRIEEIILELEKHVKLICSYETVA